MTDQSIIKMKNLEIIDDRITIQHIKMFGKKEIKEVKIGDINTIQVRSVIYTPSVYLFGRDVIAKNVSLVLNNGDKEKIDGLTNEEYFKLIQTIRDKNPKIALEKLPFWFGASINGLIPIPSGGSFFEENKFIKITALIFLLIVISIFIVGIYLLYNI